MHPFPHHYEAELEWKGERTGVLRAPPRPDILGGPPPQFDGSDRVWSPEHLLLNALNLCQMSTFFALAAKAGLTVETYRSKVSGTLEKGAEGIGFTSFALKVSVRVADADKEKAEALLHTAKKYCLVSGALKVHPTLETAVNA